MKIDKIQGINMDLTEAIEDYVKSKIDTISKFVDKIEETSMSVEIGKPSERHNKGEVFYAEFLANINGEKFHASQTADDLYKAIDSVQSNIKRQVIDWKKKNDTLIKKQGRAHKEELRA